MHDLAEHLARCAAAAGVSPDETHRLHLLEGVVRRWGRSRHAGDLVLGGSLLTRQWVGLARRTVKDLDFVARYPHDVEATVARFREALAEDGDGVRFDATALRGEATWMNTDLPSVRIVLPGVLLGRTSEVQIDVGFHYPLGPLAYRMDYAPVAGDGLVVPALRPEWMVAWKLNGLFFRGRGRWLPKGLFDLYLLTAHVGLDEGLLGEAVREAFERTAIPLARIPTVVYRREFWEKPSAEGKWESFRAACAYPVPENVIEVAAQVARRLRPVLGGLIALPSDRTWPADEAQSPSGEASGRA